MAGATPGEERDRQTRTFTFAQHLLWREYFAAAFTFFLILIFTCVAILCYTFLIIIIIIIY